MHFASFATCRFFCVFFRIQQVYAYTGCHGCQGGIRVAESCCDNADCKKYQYGLSQIALGCKHGQYIIIHGWQFELHLSR